MRGARIAETVTVPGVFLADVCEALVASIPGDVEKCADCEEPFLATARRNGRQVHLCKSHLHRFAIAESAKARALKTELIAKDATIAALALVRAETDSEIAKALPSPGERDVLGVAVAGLPAGMRLVFTSWLARVDAASDLYRLLATRLRDLVNKETER